MTEEEYKKLSEALSSIAFTMHFRVKPKYLGHCEDENLDILYDYLEKEMDGMKRE